MSFFHLRIDLQSAPVFRDRCRKILAIRIKYAQVQVRGSKLRIQPKRLVEQELYLLVTIRSTLELIPQADGVIVVRQRIRRLKLRKAREPFGYGFGMRRADALKLAEKKVRLGILRFQVCGPAKSFNCLLQRPRRIPGHT